MDYCKNCGEKGLEYTSVSYKVKNGDNILIDHAPCFMCNKCDEKNFDDDVQKHIDFAEKEPVMLKSYAFAGLLDYGILEMIYNGLKAQSKLQQQNLSDEDFCSIKCPVCGCFVQDGTSYYVIELQKCLVVVKNIPCKICPSCDEVEFDDDTDQKLDALQEKYQKSNLTSDFFVEFQSIAPLV